MHVVGTSMLAAACRWLGLRRTSRKALCAGLSRGADAELGNVIQILPCFVWARTSAKTRSRSTKAVLSGDIRRLSELQGSVLNS
ncbi:hypothetical protein [Saccharopolyspora flava]|uniref:hypothetical protein n=1 Tax=Saccharopolyspora flava TaxID=95161 RepID=UPI001114F250|nr:hypothetical protein [Saccharopolyspora flava]